MKDNMFLGCVVAYMLTAFGLTFMNVFVDMPKIGPMMLLLAPMVLIIGYLIYLVGSIFIVKSH